MLRGDDEDIAIGVGSNVQDNCVFHVDPGFPITIGAHCTIGHAAVVHGCTIGDNSLVGMGATILNGARIGRNCLIGANALVTEGKEIPDNSLVVGAPGKVRGEIDEAGERALAKAAETLRRALAAFSSRARAYRPALAASRAAFQAGRKACRIGLRCACPIGRRWRRLLRVRGRKAGRIGLGRASLPFGLLPMHVQRPSGRPSRSQSSYATRFSSSGVAFGMFSSRGLAPCWGENWGHTQPGWPALHAA